MYFITKKIVLSVFVKLYFIENNLFIFFIISLQQGKIIWITLPLLFSSASVTHDELIPVIEVGLLLLSLTCVTKMHNTR